MRTNKVAKLAFVRNTAHRASTSPALSCRFERSREVVVQVGNASGARTSASVGGGAIFFLYCAGATASGGNTMQRAKGKEGYAMRGAPRDIHMPRRVMHLRLLLKSLNADRDTRKAVWLQHVPIHREACPGCAPADIERCDPDSALVLYERARPAVDSSVMQA